MEKFSVRFLRSPCARWIQRAQVTRSPRHFCRLGCAGGQNSRQPLRPTPLEQPLRPMSGRERHCRTSRRLASCCGRSASKELGREYDCKSCPAYKRRAVSSICARPVSIVGAVDFHMLVVGDWFDQAQDVLLRFLVEAVKQDCVGGAIVARQFQFGIVHDHVAIVSNAEFGSDLKNNLHAFAIAGHRFASRFGFTNIACYSMDAEREQKDPLPLLWDAGWPSKEGIKGGNLAKVHLSTHEHDTQRQFAPPKLRSRQEVRCWPSTSFRRSILPLLAARTA